jgi:hypothetical protein
MRLSRFGPTLFAGLLICALTSACDTGPPLSTPLPGTPSLQEPAGPGGCRSFLSGQVTRLQGAQEPAGIRGIEVQLLTSSGDRVAQTRTDGDGKYGFKDLCPGTYTVCPGTPCPVREDLQRYSPPSREVSLLAMGQMGVDFVQSAPPPLPQPNP